MVNTTAVATGQSLSNAEIANRLDDVADLLEEQRANQYRVQAWRAGAATIRNLWRPARELFAEEGLEGLDRLPNIGSALSRAIRELVETGRLSTLERLRGGAGPIRRSIKGVGSGWTREDGQALPSVTEILDVDREYRERAAAGDLPLITPRRFNPEHERWLPVLHTMRGDRHYTALFSNTANAHKLGRTHDWVVIYFDGSDGEQQSTVVTQLKGPLIHRRVVRGRETECARMERL
jgi:hypothetical protein